MWSDVRYGNGGGEGGIKGKERRVTVEMYEERERLECTVIREGRREWRKESSWEKKEEG